jgi:hypothetical protein
LLLAAMQWGILAVLTGAALYNSATDHGILMAINCICIGFVGCSMIASKWMEKSIKSLNRHRMEMMALHETFKKALESGEITMFAVPLQPGDDPNKTFH